MKDYRMTIGLEIHAELKTHTKMFCGCINSPDEKSPNVNICPICMGYPGTLPVINKSAVKKVLLVGTALGSELADFTEFDRKNYFYPDIPKGYQISQYKYPLVSHGSLAGVEITRIHLEEDTARSSHDIPGVSLVDYNRAGLPLMELVTEPVIHSAEQAMKFAQELQLLLQYLGVSDANMEKGEMRVEVNISVSDTEKFGTKVEVKNINSFRAAGKAIDFEYARHVALLEKGETIVQETRGWDENKNITFSQRSKENAHDYRYFPEPDLPKLVLSEIPEFTVENLKKELPELPWQKRTRLSSEWGLKDEDVEAYVTNTILGTYFEYAVEELKNKKEGVKILSNYITSDLVGYIKNSTETFEEIIGRLTASKLAKLIDMIQAGTLSSRGGKDILKIICETGGEPETIATEKGLIQKNDTEEVKRIMSEIINANQPLVAEFKSGKDSVLQFFVGQGMKAMKGSGNPVLLRQVALELLQ
jgi:aspartyl-tRNA(Asn)/glutamyl-tRNA(Gln) amidotransferase subunit B